MAGAYSGPELELQLIPGDWLVDTASRHQTLVPGTVEFAASRITGTCLKRRFADLFFRLFAPKSMAYQPCLIRAPAAQAHHRSRSARCPLFYKKSFPAMPIG
jgi:hypothetical protein